MLRIAEARISRGWSQEQLAQAIGTTQQTVQRWETGQTDPQVGRVEAISAALGVTMSYLLGVGVSKCQPFRPRPPSPASCEYTPPSPPSSGLFGPFGTREGRKGNVCKMWSMYKLLHEYVQSRTA